MAEFEPLNEDQILSPKRREFWNSLTPSGEPRFLVLLNTAMQTSRPTKPNERILVGFLKMEKLHDGEPETLRQAIIARDPSFWNAFPGTSSPTNHKAALGVALRAYVRGKRAYGKPNLRK